MKDFIKSFSLGDFAKVLEADICEPVEGAPFPCRPLAGHTAARNTVLGRFTGQIGLPNLQEFKDALNDLVTANLMKVILDFSHITLTKSAVGVLVGFAASIHGRKKRLYVYQPSPQVRSVLKELELTGFFSYLETQDDVLATIEV